MSRHGAVVGQAGRATAADHQPVEVAAIDDVEAGEPFGGSDRRSLGDEQVLEACGALEDREADPGVPGIGTRWPARPRPASSASNTAPVAPPAR